jgi:ribosomal protein S18 acetylase RimI-like enzyme
MNISIDEADLDDRVQGAALVDIIDTYARGPGGQGAPISDHARSNLVAGLRAHPSATVLLAFADGRPVGTAVCLSSFSTFAGKPTINIHDLAVLPEFRGSGVGGALLAEVERRAQERGCCKITLEVHDTNAGAKRLYERTGFGPWDSRTLFVTKPL